MGSGDYFYPNGSPLVHVMASNWDSNETYIRFQSNAKGSGVFSGKAARSATPSTPPPFRMSGTQLSLQDTDERVKERTCITFLASGIFTGEAGD